MSNKIWYLFPIELYIIIQVRRIRLDLNITTKEISDYLNKNEKYIGHMESAANNSKYNDEVLNKIAMYFSIVARKRQQELIDSKDDTVIKTDYTIYDFYPKETLSDDKVIKQIPPIPEGSGPTGTLNALIESTEFFAVYRTLKEIVEKANEVQNQTWEGSNFTQPLENAVKNKRLSLTIIDGLNSYTLAKIQKKE